MKILYHKIEKDSLDKILRQGLKQGAIGETRQDPEIQHTDEFLNSYRPHSYVSKGVDRRKNIYCYLAMGRQIIDITSGNYCSPSEILKQSDEVLLKINLNQKDYFVSDLDAYDRVKNLLTERKLTRAVQAAHTYWKVFCPATKYRSGTIRRPEAVITRNIPASALQLVTSRT